MHLIEPTISMINQPLVNKIRFGTEPDNPLLIKLWLEQMPSQDLAVSQLREGYCQQFYILLEAVLDELVPRHWRRTCLDNIYLPLSSLKKLSTNSSSERQIQQLLNELTILTKYVEKSLTS